MDKIKEGKMKPFNWFKKINFSRASKVESSLLKTPRNEMLENGGDLRFERGWVFGNNGDIYVSYKTPYWYDLVSGAELDWILSGFFKQYKNESLDKGVTLSNLFFEMFPEKKEESYPGLTFDIKGGLGCEQRLVKLDKKVREFERRACQIFL